MPSLLTSAPRRKRTSAHLEHELKLVANCPVMAALSLLRGRWKLPMIWMLYSGRCSLAEFRRIFPMASEKMLAEHLSELIRDGFVVRWINPRNRRDVAYDLTELGRSLRPTLETLRAWGDEQGVSKRATAMLARVADEGS